jgi:hypothetical protein
MVGRELAGMLLADEDVAAHRLGDVVLAMEDVHATGDKGLPALNGVALDIRVIDDAGDVQVDGV